MLIMDRSDVNPRMITKIKDDIINIYQKYFEINKNDMEVKLDNGENTIVLSTSISVLKVKRHIEQSVDFISSVNNEKILNNCKKTSK